jgi:uncharacterized protein
VTSEVSVSRRVVVSLAAWFGVLGLVAVPAAAHVKVDPSTATQGSYTVLTFRVPNEEADADTVGLKVQLPVDLPLASVSVQPKVGWKYEVKQAKLAEPLQSDDGNVDEADSEIDWSGGKIAPGEFDTFSISVGPLPTDTDQLVFKVIQQYEKADGTRSEVPWIQVATPGGAEPDHPAPVLQLLPATAEGSTSDGHAHGATTVPGVSVTSAAGSKNAAGSTVATTDTASQSSVTTALAIAVAGLVLAIVALVLALARKNRASNP